VRARARIRKTTKWAVAAVSLVLLIAWLQSAQWEVSWTSPGGVWIGIVCGRLSVHFMGQAFGVSPYGRLDFLPTQAPFSWAVSWGRLNSWRAFAIPLWMFLAPALVLTSLLWKHDRLASLRESTGQFCQCGYDRRGLPAARACPECGSLPTGPLPTQGHMA
jgi:hypothetical protein